jgi:hypothetical protein
MLIKYGPSSEIWTTSKLGSEIKLGITSSSAKTMNGEWIGNWLAASHKRNPWLRVSPFIVLGLEFDEPRSQHDSEEKPPHGK